MEPGQAWVSVGKTASELMAEELWRFCMVTIICASNEIDAMDLYTLFEFTSLSPCYLTCSLVSGACVGQPEYS